MGSRQWKIHCAPSSKLHPKSQENSFLPELTLTVYTEYDMSSLRRQESSSLVLLLPAGRRNVVPPSPKPPLGSPQHSSVSSQLGDPTDIYSTSVQNRKRRPWATGLSLIIIFFSSLLGKHNTSNSLCKRLAPLNSSFSQLQHKYQQQRSHHSILQGPFVAEKTFHFHSEQG